MTSRYCFARLSSNGSSLGGSGCSKISRIRAILPFYIRLTQGHWEVPVAVQVGILRDRAWLQARESESVARVVGHERPFHSAPLRRVGRRPCRLSHPTSLCSHSPQF